MSISIVSSWLLGIMLTLVPCKKTYYVPIHAQESIQQCEERYKGISQSIAEVVYHPDSTPLWSGTRHGRARTALTILTVMYFESGFRRDIDLGIERERLSRYGWNDYGRSWCMMQINLGNKASMVDGEAVTNSATTTPQGWTGKELIADRRKCIAAGLHILRTSFRACPGQPFNHKLNVYASGSCNKGVAASTSRMKKMVSLYKTNRPTFNDVTVNYLQNGFSCTENKCAQGQIEANWFGPFNGVNNGRQQ